MTIPLETATSDAVLAQAAAGGDEAAFAQLYERYFGRLYDFVLRMVKDRDLAADVVQATMIRAWHSIESKGAPEHVKAWLFTVARNEAIDQIRRRRREVPLSDGRDEDQREFTIVDESRLADPEAGIHDDRLVGLVWAAARALNPREYALLDMHLRQDLNAEEIADAMGLNVGAVYTALSRLRTALEEAVATELLVQEGREHCRELAALLIAHAKDTEGQAARVRRAVKKHLKKCEICTEQRRRITAPAALFGALAPVVPPTAFAIPDQMDGAAGGATGRGPHRVRDWWLVAGQGQKLVVFTLPVLVVGLAVLLWLLFAGGSDRTKAAIGVADPDDVASTSHEVDTESSERVVSVSWSAQDDVAGYSIIWTGSPTEISDAVADLDGDTTSVESPELDPGSWYFVLRTQGTNGNWTSTVRLGPFVIVDSVEPTATGTPSVPDTGAGPTDTPTASATPTDTPRAGTTPQPTDTAVPPTPTSVPPTPTEVPPTPTEPARASTEVPACVITLTMEFLGVVVVPGSHHDGIFQVTVTDGDAGPVEGAAIDLHTVKSDGMDTQLLDVLTLAGGTRQVAVRTTQFGDNFLFIDDVTYPGCTWDEAGSDTEGYFEAVP